jgi:ribosomal protein S18 acetylase RimI-like enzyme
MIRAATAADVDAVLALWGTIGRVIPTTPDTPEALVTLIERDPGALLVADLDGAVVGTLIAGWDGWRGDMYRLAVAAPHRRRGIATALVRAAEERLRALGCRRVTALVAAGDPRGAAFWEATGYPRDELTARHVRNIVTPE